MNNNKNKYNFSITPLWSTKSPVTPYQSFELRDGNIEEIRSNLRALADKLEAGGRIIVRTVKDPKSETSPQAYLEFADAAAVSASKKKLEEYKAAKFKDGGL